jgi:hypothetical protein
MIPPVENAIAAFPPIRKAGNVTLKPLTLAGAIKLGEVGVDCGSAVPRDKLIQAAFILSQETDFRRFSKKFKCGCNALAVAVERTLNDAFATWIKPAITEASKTIRLTPNGLGWPLEWAEFLCGEYGWRWQEAIETPVATVFALAAACRQRHGGKHAGFDYVERQYRKDLKAGKIKPANLT